MPGKINGECQMCKASKAIYRCPKCCIIYCSLPCYKTHKETCIDSLPIANDVTPPVTTEEPHKFENPAAATTAPIFLNEGDKQKDFVPVETLRKLGSSEHLKGLLGNKHLRDMLNEVDSSRNQSKTLEQAMQIPIFTEFVDECLRVVEPHANGTVSAVEDQLPIQKEILEHINDMY